MVVPHSLRRLLFVLVTAGIVIFLATSPASTARAEVAPAKLECAALVSLQLPGFELKGLESRHIAAGVANGPARGTQVELPEHCLWRAEINPRTGVDGKHYGIGFELRLPSDWNGKFFFQGGGGMDGVVRPALGSMPNNASTAKVALARGYAVASTDAGHESQDGAFGADQQARLDYYYNAVEKVTELARQVLPRYYGTPLKRTYFLGCSNGGRQALIAAQRFPLLFDGVVSGDPAFNLTRAAIAEIWDDKAFLQVAPNNDQGQPIFSRAFADTDLKLLSDSILAKCDGLDGLKDGSIDNPQACHYDPAVLTCKAGKQQDCLSAPQVTALKKAFSGPQTSDGKPLYSDWPYDSGVSAPGWRSWKLGTSQTERSNALNMMLGPEATKSIHQDTYQPTFDLKSFDFDTAVERSRNAAGYEDATSTAMNSFSAHGGKLLLFTGMSDPIFSGNDLIRFYGKLQADNGGESKAADWAKLYLIPGMTHCGGGPALDDFDPLSALEAWVEQGEMKAPMMAKGKSFPDRVREMCTYPEYPHYNGSGSPDDARNFTCRRDPK